MKRFLLPVLLLPFALWCCHDRDIDISSNLPAERALETFVLPAGFKIELVASEPMVADPVAMEVDEHGNIYVVEMHGYPLDTTGSGKIKLLTDTNSDGRPDKAQVFADHLRLPTGIMKWKKGVIVVDVPEILYLEDTTNDGHADVRATLITGLALTNPQHTANTPLFGLDNWIYVAHMGAVIPKVSTEFNDTGAIVGFAGKPDWPQLPRDADGRNIRFRPDNGQLEMLSGESQYGQTFDEWGHQLCTSNADHLFHEVIAARYLTRNPNLFVGEAVDHIPDHGEAPEVFPITKNPRHQLLTDVGVVTSSCGVTWYDGGMFPDSFQNVTFIAEPVHNLVHADRIKDNGASFIASRLYQKKEFLASTDSWFRPVQFYIGPDGALYLIDYYRQIVEHPEWMSDSVNNSGALYNGSDKGRIYRISPTGSHPMDWCGKIDLAGTGMAGLVRNFSKNNIWWRRTAQRMLVQQNDPSAVAILKNYLDTSGSAIGVVHALWTLQNFQAVDKPILEKALKNSANGVRENALKIAESNLNRIPDLVDLMIQLQNDESPRVRFQLVCTLGDINDGRAVAVRQQLLTRDIADRWVQVAALTATGNDEIAMIKKIAASSNLKDSAAKVDFIKRCAAVVGYSGRPEDIKKLVGLASYRHGSHDAWWQAQCLLGLARAFSEKRAALDDFSFEANLLLGKFQENEPAALRSAALQLLPYFDPAKDAKWRNAVLQARAIVGDNSKPGTFRVDALQLLSLEKELKDTSLVAELVRPAETATLQKGALITLNKIAPPAAADIIIGNWPALTPGLRDEAIHVMMSSQQNAGRLLAALENKTIPASAINWPRMVSLMQNDDINLRNRARKFFTSSIENRNSVYKKFEPALSMNGRSEKGLQIFQQVCSACHEVSKQYGNAVGPDLGTIRNRDARFIMADILDPNRSIADGFELWSVEKRDGQKVSGIISSQTSSAIVLRDIGAKEVVIPRADIKSLQSSQTSLMPAGLESNLSQQDMADLLAFLKNVH
jgi:putative membrane-bound dehydrogenase-like protein